MGESKGRGESGGEKEGGGRRKRREREGDRMGRGSDGETGTEEVREKKNTR